GEVEVDLEGDPHAVDGQLAVEVAVALPGRRAEVPADEAQHAAPHVLQAAQVGGLAGGEVAERAAEPAPERLVLRRGGGEQRGGGAQLVTGASGRPGRSANGGRHGSLLKG